VKCQPAFGCAYVSIRQPPFIYGMSDPCGCICFAPRLNRKHLDWRYRQLSDPPTGFYLRVRCVLGKDCPPLYWKERKESGDVRSHGRCPPFSGTAVSQLLSAGSFQQQDVCLHRSVALSEPDNFVPAGFGPHMFHAMGPPPPFMRAPGPIHYPSQDPQRMGAHAGKHSSP